MGERLFFCRFGGRGGDVREVKIYDTTLRDGAQREGLSLSVEDKVKIAVKLDELGVQYLEGGWPGSNPKDAAFFERLNDHKFRHLKLVAFGSTRRKNVAASKDPNLQALLSVDTPVVCIFGKSWDVHVYHTLKTSLKENVNMIRESVSYLKKQRKEVVYDAEHFFDGYRDNAAYAMETVMAAVAAGADWIVLCDTNGGTLPSQLGKVVREVKKIVDVPLGIHAHNDASCAVANSMVAVEEGASQVQGTINGYGERCGNANLSSIIPNLAIKMGVRCIPAKKLPLITDVSNYVSEIANVVPDAHQPYVGQSAFAHKGGVHVSAVIKHKNAYEHVEPELVGNSQRLVVSELSGRSTIVHKAESVGIDLSKDSEKATAILKKIKEMEHRGYHFEAADGSLELLLQKATGRYRPLFRLESFRVIVEKLRNGSTMAEASVKISIRGRRVVAMAEGNGPVNALDTALRQALKEVYPGLHDIHLADYRVRVLDEKKGTGAMVRVLIETTDGETTWGTVGVHQNIIEASWQALVDSIDYGIRRARRRSPKKSSGGD